MKSRKRLKKQAAMAFNTWLYYGFETEIIVAAVRHPIHVLEAALAGAEICTMSFDVLQQLYQHPLTDIGIEMFLNDWKKVPAS